MPDVFMIGGSNGAGKTTAALLFLPRYLDVFEFVNADEIARGLNPLNPESANLAAGRIMIDRIGTLIAASKNFAFETTCAGRHHVATLQACRDAGYRINLIFYWLSSPETAIERVNFRVSQGGHDIPETTIRRRYHAGLRNLIELYLPFADSVLVLDNSNTLMGNAEHTIASKVAREELKILDSTIWQQILLAGNKDR